MSRLAAIGEKLRRRLGLDSVGTGKESQKFEASLRHKKPCSKSQPRHPQNLHSKLCHTPITKMEEALLRPSLPSSRSGPHGGTCSAVGRSPGCCLLLVQVEKIDPGPLGPQVAGLLPSVSQEMGSPGVRAGWCDCASFLLPVGQL